MRKVILILLAAGACGPLSWASPELPESIPDGVQIMLTVTKATSETEKKGFRCTLDSSGQLTLSSVLQGGMGQSATVVARRRVDAVLVERGYVLAKDAITAFRLDPKETDQSSAGMYGVGIILLLGRQSISVADHAISDLGSRPELKALVEFIANKNPELKGWPEEPQPEN